MIGTVCCLLHVCKKQLVFAMCVFNTDDINLLLLLNLFFLFVSELKSMETQQTSVERLSSGVVKLYWIWHGNFSPSVIVQ